jgi:hypothetical protein
MSSFLNPLRSLEQVLYILSWNSGQIVLLMLSGFSKINLYTTSCQFSGLFQWSFFWFQGFSLLTLLIYTGCWIGRLFFAKRISPGQNGDELFGERNFMQPMGRPKHAHKVPCFFPFKFGAGRHGEVFFHLSLVPNVFSPCSC